MEHKIFIMNRHTKPGATGDYVGRPTALGNYSGKVNTKGTNRHDVCLAYRADLIEQLEAPGDPSPAKKMFIELLNKLSTTGELVLVCWCTPKECHADVIRDLLLDYVEGRRTFA